jgi:hypothetical protein
MEKTARPLSYLVIVDGSYLIGFELLEMAFIRSDVSKKIRHTGAL